MESTSDIAINSQAAGTRSLCDLGLRSVDVLGSIEALEAGDIILCRSENNWMSRLISRLDGYWNHSLLYVGDGEAAHAFTGGVETTPLESFIQGYGDGIGVARPQRTRAERSAAADWVRSIADQPAGSRTPRYSGRDLGLTFALLRRAQARGAIEQLPDDIEGVWHQYEHAGPLEATCSGLIFRAFAEGALNALAVEPAPGLQIHDGYLSAPVEESVLDVLLNENDKESARLAKLRVQARLLVQATRGWAELTLSDGTVPIQLGVTPGDLWMSPDISKRWFLRESDRVNAIEETIHCNTEDSA